MFPLLKTESSEDQFQLTPPQAQAELDRWRSLSFSFDMDNERNKRVAGNRDRARRGRSRSTSTSGAGQSSSSGQVSQEPDPQDAALLAQLAAAAGMVQHAAHLGHQSYPPTLSQANYPLAQPPYFPPESLSQRPFGDMQLPPISGLDFPWAQPPPPPPPPPNQYSFNTLFPSYPYMIPPYGNLGPMGLGNNPLPITSTGTQQTTQHPQQAQQPFASTSATNQEAETEPDTQSLTEEKRRRNTAASARFRIKKKMRTTNLERSVSDLTGRAEELEREVADLRRENGWLKEIVMLKGSRFSGIEFPLQPPPQIAESSSQGAATTRSQSSVEPTTPASTASPVTTHIDSEDDEEEEEIDPSSKGKGKKKGKASSSKETSSKKDSAGSSQ